MESAEKLPVKLRGELKKKEGEGIRKRLEGERGMDLKDVVIVNAQRERERMQKMNKGH